MNIAINALSASSYGGLNYLTNLLENMLEIDSKNRYFVFVSDRNIRAFKNNYPNCRLMLIKLAGDNILYRFIWEQFILPFVLRKHKVELLYMPNGIDIFLSQAKSVICIQNMEIFFYRKYSNSLRLNTRLFILHFFVTISLRTSDKVIAVSEFVKDFLVQHLKIPDSKIVCIYHGRDEKFTANKHEDTSVDILRKFEINNDYILLSSKMIAYANIHSLIKAFSIFVSKRKSDIMLLIAGGLWDRRYYDKLCTLIKSEGLEKRIRFLGYVAHFDMPNLFWKCKMFVFPSKLEACPITLIEAMAAGSAIITSNVEPMPEICSDAALYFHLDNEQELAEKINRLDEDEVLRRAMGEKAKKRSEYFSWNISAVKTKMVFEEVVKNV